MSLDSLYDFLWPQRRYEDDPEKYAGTMIFLQTILLSLLLRWPMAIIAFFQPYEELPMTSLLLALAMTLSLVVFRWLQDVFWPAQVGLTGYAIFVAMMMYNSGGISSPITIGIVLPVLYALLVLGWRWALFWTLVFVVLISIFQTVQVVHLLPMSVFSEKTTIQYWYFRHMMTLVITLFFCYIVHKVFTNYRNTLYQQKQESSHLLQVISHDLRSPLQIVQSYIQLLEASTPDRQDLVRPIQKALDRTSLILNRIREYEGVLSGKRALKIEKTNPAEILEEALDALESQIAEKSIKLTQEIEKTAPVYVDPVAFLEQILINFLSNAVKFTPRGGEIKIRLFQKNHHVHLHIVDHGIGMSNELLERLFRFDTASHRTGTDGERGTGFGMPIAKLFADRMKIQIVIQSSEEVGRSGTTVKLALNTVP